jgi:hypothetical protein
MKVIRFTFVALLLSTVAAAQTKVSGTVQCGKPDQQSALDVADRPHHSFMIGQGKCSWAQPMEIAGAKSKDDSFTMFSEASGNSVHERGYITDTTDTGDKYTVRVEGSMAMAGDKPTSEKGTWTFVSGTGKLKGIKGKGTFEGKADGDNMNISVEGEYELPK